MNVAHSEARRVDYTDGQVTILVVHELPGDLWAVQTAVRPKAGGVSRVELVLGRVALINLREMLAEIPERPAALQATISEEAGTTWKVAVAE